MTVFRKIVEGQWSQDSIEIIADTADTQGCDEVEIVDLEGNVLFKFQIQTWRSWKQTGITAQIVSEE